MNRFSLTLAVAASLLAAPGLLAQQPEALPAVPGLPAPAPSAVDRLADVVNPGPLDEKAVRGIVNDVLKDRDARQKAADEAKLKAAAEKGHEVGSDLKLNAYWDNGLWFATANKDWRIHVGGRFSSVSVFWAQPLNLRGPPPGNGGIPQSGPGAGIGTLDDGMFFRRVRFRTDGVGYETIEYAMEVDFEQLNFVTFDHLWVGARDDYWGSARIGQVKVPMGMEMVGSDYHLTFIERSPLFDAFLTLFAPGLYYQNSFLDQNVLFQTMFHRVQPLQVFTNDFGNGNYASTSRLVVTPWYEGDGAGVLALGASYQYRTGDLGRTLQPGGTGSTFGDTQNVARFRARPNMRDATGFGSVNFLGANSSRAVDTGYMLTDGVHTVVPEFLMNMGPLSIQADAAFTYVENARTLYGGGGLAPLQNVGSAMFWGGYVEASYLLTGETRGYDRRNGTYDRVRVREPAFFVRGEDGKSRWGTGAWQVAYRYSFLDLNDSGINGGQLIQNEVALNWFLNDNTKMQFVYLNANRLVPTPATSGVINGFSVLAQWYF
jgi:phosphate-selective porin OprO/OprP